MYRTKASKSWKKQNMPSSDLFSSNNNAIFRKLLTIKREEMLIIFIVKVD